MNDDLGDSQKAFEALSPANTNLMRGLPTVCRLDGRGFHNFTKKMDRPFDAQMHDLMVKTTYILAEETNALIAYTQSDEITLILDGDKELYFNGRLFKMISSLSALSSSYFNANKNNIIDYAKMPNTLATFDCRIYQVPNKQEAVNSLVFRELDCLKNAISMAASHYFSHQQLQGKSGKEKQEMLFSVCNINFNDYPNWCKRGTYIQKKKIIRLFSTTEIESLPEKHQARTNPDLKIERQDFIVCDWKPLIKMSNKIECVFNGADPIYIQE